MMERESVLTAAARVDAQEREDRVGGTGALFRPLPPPTLRAVAAKEDDLEASVATEALDAVLKCRGKQHGDFTDHARITQNLKAMMVDAAGKSNWNSLKATQREALEMIQHKIGRILAGDPNHADHWLDIEGYARIARERL